jgi:hypothetical protein
MYLETNVRYERYLRSTEARDLQPDSALISFCRLRHDLSRQGEHLLPSLILVEREDLLDGLSLTWLTAFIDRLRIENPMHRPAVPDDASHLQQSTTI